MKYAVADIATKSVSTTMRMILVRMDRCVAEPRLSISDRLAESRPVLAEERAQPTVELEGLTILLGPDRHRVDAACRIAASRFEHGFDRWILVDADACGPRIGSEGTDEARVRAQDRVAQREAVGAHPVDQGVPADRLDPQRGTEQALLHQRIVHPHALQDGWPEVGAVDLAATEQATLNAAPER